MVLWCKGCSRLIGFTEPYDDWSVDSRSICPECFKLLERSPVLDTTAPHGPHHALLQPNQDVQPQSQKPPEPGAL